MYAIEELQEVGRNAVTPEGFQTLETLLSLHDFSEEDVFTIRDAYQEEKKLKSVRDQYGVDELPSRGLMGEAAHSFGKMVTDTAPKAIAQSIQGKNVSHVSEETGGLDAFINRQDRDLAGDPPSREYVLGKKGHKSIVEGIEGGGASLPISLAGFGVGGATAALLPADPATKLAAGTGAAMAASGTIMYRVAANEFLRQVRDHIGSKITPEQWEQIKQEVDKDATESGLWEAGTEALSEGAAFLLFKAPVGKILRPLLGKAGTSAVINNVATRAAAKYTGMLAAEAPTEALSQQKQSEILSKHTGEKPPTYGESFRGSIGPTAVTTAMLGGGFKAMDIAGNVIKKIRVGGKELTKDDVVENINAVIDSGEDVSGIEDMQELKDLGITKEDLKIPKPSDVVEPQAEPIKSAQVFGKGFEAEQVQPKSAGVSAEVLEAGLKQREEFAKRPVAYKDPAAAKPVKDIEEKAHEAATSPKTDLPDPTEKQIQAGNYKKGHISVRGMKISIENPEGSTRKGVDEKGKPWETTMKGHYGYFKGGKEGKDGDAVDVFVGPEETSSVYVIDQVNPETGKFDEHKTIVGVKSEKEATDLYLSNYDRGWKGLGAITKMGVRPFKKWLKQNHTKPVGELSWQKKKKESVPIKEVAAEESPVREKVVGKSKELPPHMEDDLSKLSPRQVRTQIERIEKEQAKRTAILSTDAGIKNKSEGTGLSVPEMKRLLEDNHKNNKIRLDALKEHARTDAFRVKSEEEKTSAGKIEFKDVSSTPKVKKVKAKSEEAKPPETKIPKEIQHLDWKLKHPTDKTVSASELDDKFWGWYNETGKAGAKKEGVLVRKNWAGDWYAKMVQPKKAKETPSQAKPETKIPKVKDTEQALAFGKKATPEQIKEIKKLRAESQKVIDKQQKAKDFDALPESTFKGQLYREAMEAYEGKGQTKKQKPSKTETKLKVSEEGTDRKQRIIDKPPTEQEKKNIRNTAVLIKKTMRQAGLSKADVDRVSIDLKPIMSVSEDAQESIDDWVRSGIQPGTILGASTIDKFKAVVELSLEQDPKKMRRTVRHETFHIMARWLLPEAKYNNLMEFYNGNEETTADAFADHLEGITEKKRAIRVILTKLHAFIKKLGNYLRGMGFTAPSDIFEGLRRGKYQAERRGGGTTISMKAEDNADIRLMVEDDYAQNRKTKRDIYKSSRRTFKNVRSDISEGVDKYMGAISTRLGNVSRKLKSKLRRLDFDTNKKLAANTKTVLPLLKKAKKMTRSDFIDWDYARKNSDVDKINELVGKYGMEKEYEAYRKVLDDIRNEAIDVGMDLGFIEEYAPRVLKDSKGFLEAIGKANDWGVYTPALKRRAKELGYTVDELSPDQKAEIISNIIAGGRLGIGGPVAAKQRQLKKIPAYLNQYYMDSDAALMSHLHSMRKHIEIRRFLGRIPKRVSAHRKALRLAQTKVKSLNELLKTDLSEEELSKLRSRRNKLIGAMKEHQTYIKTYAAQRDYTENIGAYISELIENGDIKEEHETAVNEILTARFHEAGTRGLVQAYKNISYIDTMGSPVSALTQIGDLAWSAYEGGLIRALKHAYKSLRKKSRITKEDVGIDRIAQEFADAGTLGDAVSWVFKAVGLEKIDSIGKESLLNTSLEKYQKQAKKDPAKLKKQIAPIFEGETDQVINDLLNDEITENVKLLAYHRLLDFQPVALSEMPQKYLTAGNGRLFYMLKTFTLKQFDAFRNEAYLKIKNGDRAEKVQGMKNLIRLASFFVLANAGADELKDWILGRKTDLSDRAVDNALRLFGVSKFVTWKARTEGVGSALARQILPPFKFADSLGKDIITSGDEKGLEILRSVPLIGKLAYWHMGRGVTKRQDLWERRLRTEKRKLKVIKQGYEESTNRTQYRRKHRKDLSRLDRINALQGTLNRYKKRINKIEELNGSPEKIERLRKKRIDLIRKFLSINSK